MISGTLWNYSGLYDKIEKELLDDYGRYGRYGVNMASGGIYED